MLDLRIEPREVAEMQEQPQKPTSNIANDSFPGLGDSGARLAAGADGTLEIPSFDRHDFRYLLRVVEVNVLTAISLNL